MLLSVITISSYCDIAATYQQVVLSVKFESQSNRDRFLRRARVAQWVRQLDYLTSLSPKRSGFAPGFVNYKKGALDMNRHCRGIHGKQRTRANRDRTELDWISNSTEETLSYRQSVWLQYALFLLTKNSLVDVLYKRFSLWQWHPNHGNLFVDINFRYVSYTPSLFVITIYIFIVLK